MSENIVFVKRYAETPMLQRIDMREVMRHAGYLGLPDAMDDSLREIFETVAEELKGTFSYKVCYRRMELEWQSITMKTPFKTDSSDLAKLLKGCDEAILFAATVGIEIDRRISKYQHISQAKALLAQAYGAERVETLCNVFCAEIQAQTEKENLKCTARFSPGYGDLPLETQRDFFRLLDCSRKIGISLNDSLLMTPSKSVTAIFGLRTKTQLDHCDLLNDYSQERLTEED